MLKKIACFLGIIVSTVVIIGAANTYICYFAKDADLKALTYRFDQKVLSDRYEFIWRRVKDIEIKYGTDPRAMPADIRKIYFDLKLDLEKLDKQLRKGG